MTDEELLSRLQNCERRCEDGRQSAIRKAADLLHRETTGRGDGQTRQLIHQVLAGLSRGSMRELDDAIQRVGQYLDRQMDKRHDYMRAYGASPSTIRDRAGIQQAYDHIALQACTKLAAKLTETLNVNKTSTELQAELNAALIAESKAADAKAICERLDYEHALANGTVSMLALIRQNLASPTGQHSPQGYLARFRKELGALASTYGYKIVLVGDRTIATLVQL